MLVIKTKNVILDSLSLSSIYMAILALNCYSNVYMLRVCQAPLAQLQWRMKNEAINSTAVILCLLVKYKKVSAEIVLSNTRDLGTLSFSIITITFCRDFGTHELRSMKIYLIQRENDFIVL